MQKIICFMVFSFLIVACKKETIRGSGNTLTESRTLPAFMGVRIEGSGKAIIVQGTQQSVEVKRYENLLPVYQTERFVPIEECLPYCPRSSQYE